MREMCGRLCADSQQISEGWSLIDVTLINFRVRTAKPLPDHDLLRTICGPTTRFAEPKYSFWNRVSAGGAYPISASSQCIPSVTEGVANFEHRTVVCSGSGSILANGKLKLGSWDYFWANPPVRNTAEFRIFICILDRGSIPFPRESAHHTSYALQNVSGSFSDIIFNVHRNWSTDISSSSLCPENGVRMCLGISPRRLVHRNNSEVML
jgi:hypothetical protein